MKPTASPSKQRSPESVSTRAHRWYRERVSIKIPTTPESIVACQYLEKIGIRTLATCLFSVPQALAASQAGCLYIAPYFNGKHADISTSNTVPV